ncbi:MAG: N-formylglutamate amidohydrolase [Sphaerochaetaceae bacterium]|jgi:N-formylglutamate deformylase|nr:N-formylglutamate amidohydrolase [Sphaerochaetaceae bacterium]
MKEKSFYKSIILHIPHSSTFIPEEVRDQFVLTDEELANEQLKLVDLYTRELFYSNEFPTVEAEVSRLVCDVERFLDPNNEPMSQYGMGAIYIKTLKGLPLRRELFEEEKKSLLERYYHQHRAKVEKRVEEALDDSSIAVIVDCHSFPSEPFPYEKPSRFKRPDICIGADFSHHTAEWLRNLTRQHFSKLGYSVLFNDPFKGCYIPTNYYKKDKGVFGVMLELNRSLYMDEISGEKTKGYSTLKTHIQEYYIKLKEYVDKLIIKPKEG